MPAIIDTSSLLNLVRYYHPFDRNKILFGFVKDEFANGELILIDQVFDECKYIAGRSIPKSLDYLFDKSFQVACGLPFNTKSIIPPDTRQFYHFLDNDFTTRAKNDLSDVEFEIQKERYLKSADARMILLALEKLKNGESTIVVTEETRSANDNKVYKKIPAICEILGIESWTLPEFLGRNSEIGLEFKKITN